MSLSFEENRTTWEIRVTKHELIRTLMLLNAIHRAPDAANVVWLTKVDPVTRAWIISERMVTTWITESADYTDPTFALPIPDSFISSLLELVADDDGIDIFCNEVEGTIIGRADDRYVVIDHPENVKFTSNNLPYQTKGSGTWPSVAIATVKNSDLEIFAEVIMNGLSFLTGSNDVLPFVTIDISKNRFAWTSDWRRFGLHRTSGGVPARTTGNITTQFYPYPVARILKMQDSDDDANIFIGGEEADYVYIGGDDWGIRVVNDTEINARWYSKLRRALYANQFSPSSMTSERMPSMLTFEVDGHECFASLHTVDEDKDESIGRLTCVLATSIDSSLKIYEEINALNATLVGATVVLRNNELRVITDFPTDAIDNLADVTSHFVAALRKCNSLNEFLPLFVESELGAAGE